MKTKTIPKPIKPTTKSRKTLASVVAAEAATLQAVKRRRPRVIKLSETDDVLKEQVGGFVTFIREHAIVGLAVGFIVGQQAQGVVKQLVASVVDPMIQLFIGGAKLSDRKFTAHLFHNSAEFGWGAMVYILLNLLFVLGTIYALIKLFKLDKLDIAKPVVAVEKKKSRKKSKKAKKSTAK